MRVIFVGYLVEGDILASFDDPAAVRLWEQFHFLSESLR